MLVRILVAPQHKDRKTGLPRSAALTHAETIGLSVLREERATGGEIPSVAERLVANARMNGSKKAGVFGVLRINCNAIRTFCWDAESNPTYCVYDTALQVVPSHSDAFQRVAGVPDGVPDARRNALFERVKAGFVPVADFRGGLLRDLAPGSGA
jgi:hypothetical protein